MTTQTIIVNSAEQTVQVVRSGPQGPPGISAGGAAFYEHTQATAVTNWVINHNLGFQPSIQVWDDSSPNPQKINAKIIHHTTAQAEVQMLTPRAGTAYCS